MLDFSQSNILRLAITWVGNKDRNEGVVIPDNTLVTVNEFAHEVLTKAFFKPFEKSEEFFYFADDEDVSHNASYQSCMEIFSNAESFNQEASKLTQRLYELCSSPKINGGEFFVVLFDGVSLLGEAVPALGIFKVISKEPFLRVEKTAVNFALQVGEGIASGKIAFSALIFGVDETEGYRVMQTDTMFKKEDVSMWTHQFLGLKPIEDHYYNTRHYMNIASEFINEKAPAKFSLNNADTIDLLNKSAFYFKENDLFDAEDFSKTLFEDPAEQTAFLEFKQEYEEDLNINLENQFDISKQALKKSNKLFKRVIKLDENFQIQITDRVDLIERGYDEEKRKSFYKIYYDREE